jgi:hypothetical protein
MPTNFVVTTFVVLTTLNNAGQLAPVDKAELPAGSAGPIAWNEAQCMLLRGKMSHPEKYVCQPFASAKSTQWTYQPPGSEVAPSEPPPELLPPPKPERFLQDPTTLDPKSDIEVNGKRYTRVAGLAWIEEKEVSAAEQAPPKAQPQRRVRYAQQQFDPLGAFLGLFTPRGDW